MDTTGVDVSSVDGVVDWRAVARAGHAFVYVKASEGRAFRDVSFFDNWGRSGVAGLLRGAYHFARPAPGTTGTDEAAWFAHVMQSVGAQGHLPPVLALQWRDDALPPAQAHAWAASFVYELQHLTGRRPLIYTGRFWRTDLLDSNEAWGCPLWLAHYGTQPELPAAWSQWTLWQHTPSGSIAGLPDSRLGISRFHGTHADLMGLDLSRREVSSV